MAINQILPFGTGAGANVMTPADYTALVARTTGFQAGVAKSMEVNTPLRQSAFVAAMIGQFAADLSGTDVLDDGDVANLKAIFLAALNAQTQTRVASAVQSQALTDNTVLLTPKRLDDSYKGANQSFTTQGFQKVPGGVIEQWVRIGHTSGMGVAQAYTFPFAFPNKVLGISIVDFSAPSAGAVVFSVSELNAIGFSAFWNYSNITSGTPSRAAYLRIIGH